MSVDAWIAITNGGLILLSIVDAMNQRHAINAIVHVVKALARRQPVKVTIKRSRAKQRLKHKREAREPTRNDTPQRRETERREHFKPTSKAVPTDKVTHPIQVSQLEADIANDEEL